MDIIKGTKRTRTDHIIKGTKRTRTDIIKVTKRTLILSSKKPTNHKLIIKGTKRTRIYIKGTKRTRILSKEPVNPHTILDASKDGPTNHKLSKEPKEPMTNILAKGTKRTRTD